MDLFPAIDLRDGRAVRLTQGDYGRETRYADDPVAVAVDFEAQGAVRLHVVDLDAARTGEATQHGLVARICAETGLRVEVGGGVRTTETVDALLAAGVERVVVGTAALRNWAWFESLAGKPDYAGKLVLGLDARDGKAQVDGWTGSSGELALDIAQRVNGWPLGAIVFTDIAVDGTLAGPNVESTRVLAEATDVPVVASGGVGVLGHLEALRPLPIEGVIVGKAIYEGAFTVAQALETLRGAAAAPEGAA
ncbi:MAG: 1-(5-phosphoribosyl)-5-[(5-phosphoribosylamino)methylideneamino]imidazole-4-carboxamide isomerase [Planctomycetota bacterium]